MTTEKYRLSRHMRDALVAHLDGKRVPIVRTFKGCANAGFMVSRNNCINAMIKRGWIKVDLPHGPSPIRPRFTVITEEGRAALALVLADWAEALVLAGYTIAPPSREPAPIAPGRAKERELA